MGNYKWCGHIFSRHGSSKFSGWWFDEYIQNLPIQVHNLPNNMPYKYTYTLAYFSLDDVDVDTI